MTLSHGMRWRCSFHFRYVTNKILFTLQVYYARSDGYWCIVKSNQWIIKDCVEIRQQTVPLLLENPCERTQIKWVYEHEGELDSSSDARATHNSRLCHSSHSHARSRVRKFLSHGFSSKRETARSLMLECALCCECRATKTAKSLKAR